MKNAVILDFSDGDRLTIEKDGKKILVGSITVFRGPKGRISIKKNNDTRVEIDSFHLDNHEGLESQLNSQENMNGFNKRGY